MQNYFRIIIIICLISSLARFVLDSYLPSLPAIGLDFGLTGKTTQFTLTLYLLGFSISQLIYGPLSDYYGRRIVILVGLLIFISGNLICCFASSHPVLLLARLIAGAGAGACGVLNRAIASDCFKGPDFSKAWSYTTTTLVITLCIAPIIGGYIQGWMGWRANFMLASLYVVFVFIIILKFLPETNHYKISNQIDQASLSIHKILQNYYIIFTNKNFLSGALCYSLAFSGLIAYFQVSPFLFIDVLGLTPAQYGWCSLIIASTYLSGGLIVNQLVHRLGTHYLLAIGAFLLILGGILMVMANTLNFKDLWGTLLPSAIYVMGARLVIPNAIADSMQKVRHMNGSSSALLGCLQMLGSAIVSSGIAFFSYTTSLPLAWVMTALGCITLLIHFKFIYKHNFMNFVLK